MRLRLFSALLAATLLTAHAADAKVVVASKIDTEGSVLGSIILLALEAAGIETEDRTQLGATSVVRKAIVAGAIDVYPEYTGNAAFFFSKPDPAIWQDADKGFAEAKQLDWDANRIVWLPAAPANNTWAIAVRGDVAGPAKLVSMSDFGRWVNGGGAAKLAGSSEFINSPAALPAFQAAYGFKLGPEQLIELAGGDTAATIKAAAERISGANAAMVYGTDGAIQAAGLVVMADDKGVQPVYRPAPIVRDAVLKDNPKIAEILPPIFAKLDLQTLQTLNGRVQVDGVAARDVARDFLRQAGFLK